MAYERQESVYRTWYMDYKEQMTGDSGLYSRQQQESLFFSKTPRPTLTLYQPLIESAPEAHSWEQSGWSVNQATHILVSKLRMRGCVTSLPLSHAFMARCLIQYRDMCAFFDCVRRSAYESELHRPTFTLRSHAPWAAEEKKQNVLRSKTGIRVVRWQGHTRFVL
jgi:hypothetical protein